MVIFSLSPCGVKVIGLRQTVLDKSPGARPRQAQTDTDNSWVLNKTDPPPPLSLSHLIQMDPDVSLVARTSYYCLREWHDVDM